MRSALSCALFLAVATNSCAYIDFKSVDMGGPHDGFLLYQYTANACEKDVPLKLPASVSKAGWWGSARDSGHYHCQGFTIYDLRQGDPLTDFSTYVRSEATNSCTLQVAIAAKHHCSEAEPNACPDKAKGQEAAARVLDLIGVAGTTSDRFDVFETPKDFTKWCRKRVRQKVYAREHLSLDE